MQQYWEEEGQIYQAQCPIHNYAAPHTQNQNNYNYNRNIIVSRNYSQQQQIYSQGQFTKARSGVISNEYKNYNLINPNQNRIISSNYNNYPQYSYQNDQKYNYKTNQINRNNNNSNFVEVQYINQAKNYMNSNSNSNINNDKYSRNKSPDGVIRGYSDNYSFYISGTTRPKVTINLPNQNNNDINNNYQKIPQRQYVYQTSNIPRGNNSQNQKFINSNSNYNINSNNNKRIINQNNISTYVMRDTEKKASTQYI